MSHSGTVFITVGTTEFDELIKSIDTVDFLKSLEKINCTHLVVQIGRGLYEPIVIVSNHGIPIKVEVYRFKPNLDEDMNRAKLIISHCGAGSILEAVKNEKELIVVVNSSLQDNHQTELADAMSAAGYCISTTPQALCSIIESKNSILQSNKVHKTSDIPITEPGYFCKALCDMFEFKQ